MRKIGIGAALMSALIAGPVLAEDRGFYAGAELGAVIASDTDHRFTPGAVAGSVGNVSMDHELGFNGAVFAGYDFGVVRLEVEGGYLSAGVDGLSSSFAAGGGLTAGSQGGGGDVSARIAMANAMLDLGEVGGFTVFLGAGAGGARVKVSDVTTAGGAAMLDDEDGDWRFAWQGVAGVRRPLGGNAEFHVRYRYFDVGDVEMIGLGGRVVTSDLTAHSVAAGVTWKF